MIKKKEKSSVPNTHYYAASGNQQDKQGDAYASLEDTQGSSK